MNAEKIVNWPGITTQGIEHGIIRGGGDEVFIVHGSSGVLVAMVAFSCLVKPKVGDKVMYIRDPQCGCYILTILERPTGPDVVLSFPGDLMVESINGNVTINAASGIELATGSAVSLRASEVSISAVNGRLNILDLRATCETFTGNLKRVHLISDAIDAVVQRVTQRLKSCYRWVENIEHATVGQMIHKVSNLYLVSSRQSCITAEDDVKIDGERVHIG